ncbi:MAG: glycosyltransferase family 2 protein [Bdellovibrionales bacterium]|nr:glycosyltransferase family 2 protein [Bdellovibrionales bacterium]
MTTDASSMDSPTGTKQRLNVSQREGAGEHAAEPLTLSLVIPVYNEADHLNEFLNWIDNYEFPLSTELVIVDDHSRDGSEEVIRSFSFTKKHQYIRHPVNRGKGAAVRTGIERASGTIVGVQDADFEYDIADLSQLLLPLMENRADVVFGSRFKRSNQVHRTFHYLINRFLTIMSNLLSGLYLSDMETCYKLFRADVIKNVNLEADRFGFEPEITAKIARLKLRVMELPISYFPRNYIEGKKITWKDGVAALGHIVYFNLLQSKRDFFKSELPQKYIPRDGNWL